DAGIPVILDANETGDSTILILWDGSELEGDPDGRLLKSHLTPLDWALAFSTRVLDELTPTELPDIRINIIDLTGEKHTEWAMRNRFQLLAEMPWVTLHAPLLPKKKGRYVRYRDGYHPLVECANSLLVSDGNGNWKLRGDIRTVAGAQADSSWLKDYGRQWTASVVQTGDQHDLNNLIGSWVIHGNKPELAEWPALSAFYQRIHWMGLLDSVRNTPVDAGRSDSLVADDFSTIGAFNILAIDDRMNDGWSDVTATLVFGDGHEESPIIGTEFTSILDQDGVCLLGATSPQGLLERMKHPEEFFRRYFDSVLHAEFVNNVSRPWMLILDLHLWETVTEENAAFRHMLGIARSISRNGEINGLAWPGFAPDSMDTVEAWLDKGGSHDDNAYNIALSLLPRLCALRWPAVPILIFSGTGRSALIGALADYGNIFLVNRKPNVLGADVQEQVRSFVGSFSSEFRRARPLIEVQKSLLYLESCAKRMDGPSLAVGGDEAEYHHLTVAFEEAGDFRVNDKSAIGGVIIDVPGESSREAAENSMKFLERLREKGVNFYDHVPAFTELGQQGKFISKKKKKKTSISSFVEKA
ncbi:MAG: hypothetical protein AB2796_19485, partial [Candidatus Thiodiazotropha sp.]